MKIRFTRINLHKDPTFDTEGLLDEESSHPYIVEFKRHWYSRWKYVIDPDTGCPKLFFGDYSICIVKDFMIEANKRLAK